MTKPLSGLEYFESLASLEGKKFTSLETAARLLDLLGNPQDRVKSIHVAGTNGKGTVCALISAMLHATGASVGQAVSPHLQHVTERCLVNGRPADAEDFGRAVETVVDVAQGEGLIPGFFVLGLVAAFYEFARLGLDWMVIEVGIGGTFDASNTITSPQASVITNVSLDHVEILGRTVAEIACNKAGIIKSGVPVFVGQMDEEAKEAIGLVATQKRSPIEFFGKDFFYDAQESLLRDSDGRFKFDCTLLHLKGEHQLLNSLLAIRVARYLKLREEEINVGLNSARWPGRLESFNIVHPEKEKVSVRVLTDVAHNPGGIEALIKYLKTYIKENSELRKLIFLISIVDRKDWRSMLCSLKNFAEDMSISQSIECVWVCTHSGYEGAVQPTELATFLPGGSSYIDAETALTNCLLLSDQNSLVVVTGSVFLIGRLRPMLTEQPFMSIASDVERGEQKC